ncbi:MAG: hypothetical protein IKC87_04555 [Clostridia bacterium]|nr:hypothetical protein [Clostridia bacterium]
MKNGLLSKILMLLSLALCLTLCLCACGGNDDTDNGGSPSNKSIRIWAEKTEIEVGREIILEKQANYSPFYQSDLSYEVVGENTCGVTFRHSLNNNWYTTYVSAASPGSATVIIKHNSNGETVQSNALTLTFTANKITNAGELAALGKSSGYYVLDRDIDLTGIDFSPIKDFSGILDGGGHKIVGLKFEATNESGVGLFATLLGTVKNLTLDNCEIGAIGMSEKIGAVAGVNSGAIENVTVNGSVNAKYFTHVGGIVGYNDGGTINGCTNNATVVGDNKVGGIVGTCYVGGNDFITKNTNNGSVSGDEQVGGIAGVLTTKNVNGTHGQSLLTNTATVSGETKVGGIIGDVYGSYYLVTSTRYGYNYLELSLLNNSGDVTAEDDYVGGVVGKAMQLTLISASKNTATLISGADYVGGFIGYGDGTAINADDAPNNSVVSGHTYVGGIAGYAGKIENAENNGTVSASSLSDGKTYLGGIAGYCTGAVKCKNNSPVTSTGGGKYVGGIAGYLNLVGVENATGNKNAAAVSGADYTGGVYGAFVTASEGGTYALTNSENSGSVTGGNYVGGIAGEVYGSRYVDGSTYRNAKVEATILTNTGTVLAEGDYAGGLYGYGFFVTVINTATNSADITGGSYVGGLVGKSQDTVIYAMENENINTITGKAYVGGFAGYTGVVNEAINKGSVISTESIVENDATVAYLGGIAGYCLGVHDCVNNADISVTHGGAYVGGIAGKVYTFDENSVTDNVNTASVSGTSYVGGIVGLFRAKESSGTYFIKNCENSGNISGVIKVGGIAGYVTGSTYLSGSTYRKNSAEVAYCINSGAVSGTSCYGGILGFYDENYFKTEQFDTNTDNSGKSIGTII